MSDVSRQGLEMPGPLPSSRQDPLLLLCGDVVQWCSPEAVASLTQDLAGQPWPDCLLATGQFVLDELRGLQTAELCRLATGMDRWVGRGGDQPARYRLAVTVVPGVNGEQSKQLVVMLRPTAPPTTGGNGLPPLLSPEDRTILQAMDGAVFLLDGEHLILEANDSGETLFGYGPLRGRKVTELLPEKRGRLWKRRLKAARQGGEKVNFMEVVEGRYLEVILQPLPEGRGEAVTVAVVRDITEQWVCELRYRQLYEHMARGVLICESPDDGMTFVIKDCNQSCSDLLAMSREELLALPLLTLFSEGEEGFPAAVRRVFLTGKPEHRRLSYRSRGGAEMLLNGQLMTLPNRELVVILEDVTHQRRTEEVLRRSKEEWERTFDALTDIVTIQDREMRIVRANQAAYAILGEKFGALIGKRCYEIFQDYQAPCEGCPVVETNLDFGTHNGVIYNEKLQKTFDVRSSPIYDDQGALKWVVQIARDVTENRQHERERNMLFAAIEQASESIMITDRQGVLQYVNPAFTGVSGYAREEVLGKPVQMLQSGQHDDQFYQEMWQRLEAGKVWRGKLVNRRKNGSLFKEDATISPVFDEQGTITNYIALKRDITREDSLERQLQQAMKMEAIGTLAGGIAHDFNNILSAIIGYGHIAKNKVAKDDPVAKDIDQMLTGANRAVDLVKQILTFARQEAREQFRPLKLQYIIKEVLKLLRSSLPATIKLKQQVASECSPIMADPGQIHQLLMNLCTNAKQAIGAEHGTITITLKEHVAQEVRALGAQSNNAPGRYLELCVSDSGCGMSSAMLERIFDPFFTTRAKEHGTGLGLAVVHGIVKKHHGEIFVESEEGVGTTFHVFFSVVDLQDEAQRQTRGPTYQGSERVLLVDDEDAVGSVLENMLGRLGYRISRFTDSMEAVRHFRNDPACCDLVITDMTMPNMTGSELAREMLSLRPELPIIMLTGYSEVIDKAKALQLGIREFLLKPVRREVLSTAIREVLKGGQDTDH